jgi:glycosyltransferase involved in cell wall biosynthesis/SAM-dependent methyltransferase
MIHASTIVAANYLPHARVLAESFARHNPNGSFTVLVIDDERNQLSVNEPSSYRLLRLSDIGLDSTEIGRLAGIYDVTEMATAVKPVFLKHLLAHGDDHIIYLDPDIKVYAPLDEVAALARQHSIVLTPHTMVPVPRDGRRVETANILASGVFNLGFIALGARTDDFLTWWWEQTRREALSDTQRMLFTDQRCMDLVAGFFDHFVVTDPGYNVAYWNLHGRNLAWTGTGYTVDGLPLRFFHFSGFDHRAPYLLSRHQLDQPRILLSERPAVRRICREYTDDLNRFREAGLERPYAWASLPGGIPLTRRIRRLYWRALVKAERNGEIQPPNPFDRSRADRFVQWLNQPIEPEIQPTISRLLYEIYRERPDLQAAFPQLAGGDASRYLTWVLQNDWQEEDLHADLLPTTEMVERAAQPPFAPANQLTFGVNLVGYFKAFTGVGEHARLLAEALKTTTVPFATFAVGGTVSLETHPHTEHGDRRLAHTCNLVAVNADQTIEVAHRLGPTFFEGRHTIGYWAWELERLPESFFSAFDVLHEVWCASRFVTDAVRAAHRRPTFTVPYPFAEPAYRSGTARSWFGLPDRFMFLFTFDFLSITERKNPLGLVEAFTRAFTPAEEPILVLKSINGDQRLNQLERLRLRVADLPNVILLEDYFSIEDKNGLLSVCDCYVSLHRSEGTGISLAEAMALGKPVIATAYSGNLDFMTEKNSYLVDYVMTEVPDGCSPYPRGYRWADPVLDDAARQMRRVFENRDEAVRRGTQARQDILDKHNASVCGARMAARLEEIRRSRSAGASVSSPASRPETSLAPVDALKQHGRHLAKPRAEAPADAPLREVRLVLQRLMLRATRPYWWGQSQLGDLLIDAISDLDQARAEMAAQHSRQSSALQKADSALTNRIERLETQVGALAEQVGALAEQGGALADQGGALAEHVRALAEPVSNFQRSAANHLAALSDGVSRLEVQMVDLINRLYPVPYISDPSLLSYQDSTGRKVLGFREAADNRGLYIGFEDIFRGSESFIRDRFRAYERFVGTAEPIVDIGCGRGELLELVRELGRTGIGVDLDEQMVRRCVAKGLTVQRGDGIDFLRAQADASIGVVFASQVIEHMSSEALDALFDTAHRTLKPGGLLIAETVNPHSLEALKGFWVDLTHRHPIFPEVAVALSGLHGFASAFVLFPHGSGDFESDRRTQGEYAVVAKKAE